MSEKLPSYVEPDISQPNHFRYDINNRRLGLKRFEHLVRECIKPPYGSDNRLYYVQTDKWLYMFEANGADLESLVQVLRSIDDGIKFKSYGQIRYSISSEGELESRVVVEGCEAMEARGAAYWSRVNGNTSDFYRKNIMRDRFGLGFIVKD